MFDGILKWIGTFLRWLDSWTGSYMLALFLFAVVIEILLLPLAIKQQRTSIKQAKLRPKEMAIRKKYAGRTDQATQQKMQQEVMELYQREGFNQFGGCLTMLIQLPIILALYQIVINPLKYVVHMSKDAITLISKFLEFDINKGTIELISRIKETGMAGFEGLKSFTVENITMTGEAAYNELAGCFDTLPNFMIFGENGINLGATPSFTTFNWLLIVPLLTFVVYFFSMKLTRKLTYQPAAGGADDKAMGCSNKVMDIVMPLFSVYITFVVPAAIGVYWIFKSIISTLKQFILFKTMPIPTFTEEDYKAAEKELKSQTKKNTSSRPARDPNAPKIRSLHHIDDEDYDEDGNYIADTKAPEISASETPMDAAPMKKDDRENKKASKAKAEKSEEKAEVAEAAEVTEEAEKADKAQEDVQVKEVEENKEQEENEASEENKENNK